MQFVQLIDVHVSPVDVSRAKENQGSAGAGGERRRVAECITTGRSERDRAQHLLHVIYADLFIPPTDFNTAGVFQLSRDAMMAAAREDLRKHAEQNVGSTVPIDLRVIIGEPLDVILAQMRESGADLVVMGTHGRTGVSRLMFGSVTEAVIRVAPVVPLPRSSPWGRG